MKKSKGKMKVMVGMLAIAIALPMLWALMYAKRETFMYVMLAECLFVSVGAFALLCTGLWSTRKKTQDHGKV